ncbi:MAG: type IV pilus secretin PilQ [Steroidobacteraceae bacterium]
MSRPMHASRTAARKSAGVWTSALLGALATVLLIGSQPALAQNPDKTLQKIEVQTLPGQQVQLRLLLSGPAPEPLSFTIDKPARISLDLPDTGLALESRRIDVNSAGLASILAAEANGRTRLVLNLDSLVPYTTRVDGNTIIVTLGGNAPIATASASAPAAPRASSSSSGGARAVSSIDFRRGPGGSGRVVVGLSDARIPVNLRQEGSRVIVDFTGAQLSKDLMKRFDVTDFATPVQTVDALKAADGTRLIISAGGDFEQLAYQTDNQYTIEVKPVVKATGIEEEKKTYTGERLTLNFQDIETRAVLQLLADTSGQNIVVSDTVTGNVTLRLQNVPWDQALDIVLKTKGLDMRRQDNVILVAPAEEIAAREKAELAARKDLQELAPLRTEYLQVNYAKAEELAALIGKGGSGSQSLLSERGSIGIDSRTNTLLVQDTADRLTDIRKLVATLDIPVKQVLIEARIVIVNDDFSRDLGVRTGLTAKDERPDGLLAVSGSAAATNTMIDSAITNLAGGTGPAPVAVPTGADNFTNRYNVNLPVANPAGRIAMSLLSPDYIVDLELSAAQAEGRGEIVSSPRVITANQKEATIEQGVEIPFQESSSSGATTTQFKKAVLSLKVTPLITPDNRVILDLQINKDSVGQEVASATGGRVPSIDTRKIITQVLVNDGQTVVLGGILETEKRENTNKVPWLGDIPGLNILFKSSRKVNNKSELLIFVTPKILREGANLY